VTGPTEHPAPSPARRRFGARVLEGSTFPELMRAIARTESDPEGIGIMTRKARIFPVALRHVPLKASPLLKQELLAVGADAAHARGVADHSVSESDVVLLATWGQYRRLLPKLRRQPFQLRAIADEVEAALRHYTQRAPRRIEGAHRSFEVGGHVLVMGVVNVTPDSFSDGGKFLGAEEAVAHARRLVAEGAQIIDVGGESTRPGAAAVEPEEELRRITPVIQALAADGNVPISVDTRHASTARHAIALGADLINDVTGLSDPAMRAAVRVTGAAAIVMHLRGTPETMAAQTQYVDLRGEVYQALADATAQAEAEGIPSEKLLVDPGLGFAKTAPQSLELLAHVGELRSLGYPVLVGASRKSFLGWTLGSAPVDDRLEASLAAAVVAGLQGAHIVRAHDVRPTVRALALVDAMYRAQVPVTAEEIESWAGGPE
jgi:dihydropteroate synthase